MCNPKNSNILQATLIFELSQDFQHFRQNVDEISIKIRQKVANNSSIIHQFLSDELVFVTILATHTVVVVVVVVAAVPDPSLRPRRAAASIRAEAAEIRGGSASAAA